MTVNKKPNNVASTVMYEFKNSVDVNFLVTDSTKGVLGIQK